MQLQTGQFHAGGGAGGGGRMAGGGGGGMGMGGGVGTGGGAGLSIGGGAGMGGQYYGGGVVGGQGGVQGGGDACCGVGVAGPCGGAAVAGCSDAGCIGMECGAETGVGALAYVGSGGGDYITETTYRFVGEGAGDIRFVGEKQKTFFGLGAGVLLVIVGIVGFMLMPQSTTTTTMAPVTPPEPVCQPMRDCSGCQGEQCTLCHQDNQNHCCLEEACSRCTTGAQCSQCRQDHTFQCCQDTPLVLKCLPPTPAPTPAPTLPPTTTPVPAIQSCVFWGDPHIKTFDGARPSFYGDGEFWIIKNSEVHIQGRYMGTKYTYGLAATNKVAIGGPFIHPHTIEVEPMENHGKIFVDGHEVCPDRGCTYHVGHVATIVHDDVGDLPDKAASQFERHMVHITLPKGIKLTVFRWTNYLDLDLKMRPLPGGVDGSCGNMNGDPADDTTQDIFRRIGARIQPGDMIFRDRLHVTFTDEENDMLMTCTKTKRDAAERHCTETLETSHPTKPELRACMFDECFGMNEHALRTARTFASDQDRNAAGDTGR